MTRTRNVVLGLAVSSALLAGDARGKKPAGPEAPTGQTVIVLGDSRTDGCVGARNTADCRESDLGFNTKVLTNLLGLAKKRGPAAVFFTGDLTLGLEKEEHEGVLEPGHSPAPGGWATDFQYDSVTFARMIGAFRRTTVDVLGRIPFWPVVGNHDAVGPDALSQFRLAFGLSYPPSAYQDPAHLAYAVEVGNAAFVVLATDFYVECPKNAAPGEAPPADCNLQQHRIVPEERAWLDAELARHPGKRLFVLGHEPAFSAGDEPFGLDRDAEARDAFWSVLEKHHVVAYVCSHQHRFDVSQHGGVWQIISGGAGAPLDGTISGPGTGSNSGPGTGPNSGPGHKSGDGARNGKADAAAQDACTGGSAVGPGLVDASFFHYVELRIPDDPARVVTAEVRDCKDHTRALLPLGAPLVVSPAPESAPAASAREPGVD